MNKEKDRKKRLRREKKDKKKEKIILLVAREAPGRGRPPGRAVSGPPGPSPGPIFSKLNEFLMNFYQNSTGSFSAVSTNF